MNIEKETRDVENDSLQAVEKVVEYGDVDGAAKLFKFHTPVFRNLVARCSSRELKRLLTMMVEFPLQKEQYNPKQDSVEGQAFRIGLALVQAKAVMTIAIEQMRDQKKQEKEKLNERAAEETQV